MPTVTPTCFSCGIDVPTPSGLNVQVEVVPQVGGLVGLSMIFSDVAFEGTTTVDFQIGNNAGSGASIFEWNTDFQHSGGLIFAFKLPDMISESDFANFFVFSVDSGAITEITIKDGINAPDYTSRMVYGRIQSPSFRFISLSDPTGGTIGVDSCPTANFNGGTVYGSANNSGNCVYEITCYKCDECPSGRTRNLSFKQIDGKSCSNFGQYVSACGNSLSPLAWCDAKQICAKECTGGKTFDDNCDCVCQSLGSIEFGWCSAGIPARCAIKCTGGKTFDNNCECVCQDIGTFEREWCDAKQICTDKCTVGGKTFNENCDCLCPEGKDWCDAKQTCATKCTGGKEFNNNCNCVCPESKDWCSVYERCEPKCPGAKEFSSFSTLDGSCECLCPKEFPLWCPTNQDCISCDSLQGGILSIGIDSCKCACPNGQEICDAADGQMCATECTGGKTFDENCNCVCQSIGSFEFEWCDAKQICTTKCTGGKEFNEECNCVCQSIGSFEFEWCGAKEICTTKCKGGKTFDNNCNCVCPEGEDWCGAKEICVGKCTDAAKTYNDNCLCVCPTDYPLWCPSDETCYSCGSGKILDNNCDCFCPEGKDWCDAKQICTTKCTGGKEFNEECNCVCQSIGSFEFEWCDAKQICTTKCTGGKTFDNNCNCECPEGEDWCPGQGRCDPKCPGTKEFDNNCDCVCPTDYPFWCPSDENCYSCGSGKILDNNCDCVCPTDQPCPAGQARSPSTCGCLPIPPIPCYCWYYHNVWPANSPNPPPGGIGIDRYENIPISQINEYYYVQKCGCSGCASIIEAADWGQDSTEFNYHYFTNGSWWQYDVWRTGTGVC